MAENKDDGGSGCLAVIGWLIIIGFVIYCFNSCSGSYGGSSSYSSSRSSAGSSSSETLLNEDDWMDTSDGRTYLKSKSSDGGTDYIDSNGEYVIHRNSDGSGAIADGYGNVAVDSDGDGELDKYSTDNGKSWDAL